MSKVKKTIPTHVPPPPRRGKGQTVGYIRVSSVDQNEARQLEDLALDRSFTDKASGKQAARPQLLELLAYVREGDTVVCHAMDRLARNVGDLRSLVETLTRKGVHVRFVKEGLTFTGEDNPMATLLLNVMGAIAEFERSLIRERQREGIAIAKRKGGVFLGRKRKLSDQDAALLREQALAGVPKAALARKFKVSRDTVYEYLRDKE